MSGSDERDVYGLARELAAAPGAVPVLVALLEHGGTTHREVLSAAAASKRVDDAIRWLTAVNLVRRAGGSGTFDLDQPDISYELTSVGNSLITSLVQLAKVCGESAGSMRREVGIAQDGFR